MLLSARSLENRVDLIVRIYGIYFDDPWHYLKGRNMASYVIQICTKDDDRFYAIDQPVFEEAVRLSATDCEAAKKMVMEARRPTTVHSTESVNAVLVWDSVSDEATNKRLEDESWQEVREDFGF